MRKLLIFIALLPQLALAQSKFEFKPSIEYSYNPIYLSQGVLGLVADYRVVDRCSVRLGIQANTANLYSASAGARFRFDGFYIDNSYLFRSFVRNNTQELAIALSAGYANEHLRAQLGYNYRHFTQINSDNRTRVIEPANIIYLLEYRFIPGMSKWNPGLRISNIDDFVIERYGNPIASVFTDYSLSDTIELFAIIMARPSGVFNMANNVWGLTTRIGAKLSW